jgi:hypothetical protein
LKEIEIIWRERERVEGRREEEGIDGVERIEWLST